MFSIGLVIFHLFTERRDIRKRFKRKIVVICHLYAQKMFLLVKKLSCRIFYMYSSLVQAKKISNLTYLTFSKRVPEEKSRIPCCTRHEIRPYAGILSLLLMSATIPHSLYIFQSELPDNRT